MIRRLLPLLALLLTTPAFAQLPAARLSGVFPPGAQAGSTFELTIAGADLDKASSLQFSHPGITAKLIGETTGPDAKFSVTVAKDVPVGVHDCRVSGQFGVSNPRAIVVSDLPDNFTAKPGTSPESAGKLPLDTFVAARASASAVDHWAFDAKTGQRLIIECQFREIDSKLSPSLAVIDPAGREIARSRRTGLLDFTAQADGQYVLRLHDGLYRGGPDYAYRLVLSTGPRLDHVFPPIGVAGKKQSFVVFGRNLPGGKPSPLITGDGRGLEQLTVEIDLPAEPADHQRLETAGLLPPSGAAMRGLAYRLKSDRGLSNPVPIHYGPTVPIVEEEAVGTARNDAPDAAQKIAIPAELTGRFYPRGDRDYFTFEAKKGDVYYIETVSDRLGVPTAPAVVIQKVSGDKASDVLESPDEEPVVSATPFKIATRDPSLKWEVKEDATYRLMIRDRFGSASENASAIYRLSIRKPTPDFAVLATPLSAAPAEQAVWNPTLRRGGFAPIRVAVLRRDGFTGDVTIKAEGLPEGVSADTLVIPEGSTTGLLVLSASADAKPAAGTVRMTASGKVGDAELTREVLPAAVVFGAVGDGKADAARNMDVISGRIARGMAVGVLGEEPDPLTITPEKNAFEVAANGKLSIPLKVKRLGEQKQPLKLKVVGIDGLKGAKEVTIDGKAETGTLELDFAPAKLAPGTYTLCLTSPAQIKYTRPGGPPTPTDDKKDKDKKKTDAAKDVNTVVYSAPITVKVLPAEKAEKSDKKKS